MCVCVCTFSAFKGPPGHVVSCPGQVVLVNQVEHVNQSLIILLGGEKVDCQLTRMKQRQVKLTRATETHKQRYYTE